MCYNISVSGTVGELRRRFKAQRDDAGGFKPIYHASAFTLPFVPVITSERTDTIQLLQWGLIPSWVKDTATAEKLRLQTLNAKAETIHAKPSFRHSIKEKRCLVLVDGFYEWREVKKKKYPYYIYFGDHEPFALAGIWDTWTNPKTGKSHDTFSIITTEANALLAKIHNTKKRMPVVLRPEDEREWLDQDLPMSRVDELLKPYNDKRLRAHTISRLITTRGADRNTPAVMKEFRYEELEQTVKAGPAGT